MARIVLAMSGGVDSSVAAHLLCDQGHELIGVFMRHGVEEPACDIQQSSGSLFPPVASDVTDGAPRVDFLPNELPIVSRSGERLDHKQGCCTARDALDARRVADGLGIPFYALNLDDDFARIVDYFVDEYRSGRTPNPCVMCNNWIKFGKLFEYAASVDADFVATGHYARLIPSPTGTMELRRGRDDDKDQSYVLFGVRRDDLHRMLLPLGDFRKTEIRQMAAHRGVLVAEKKDSQEICFVTSGHHAEFVRERSGGEHRPGDFVTTDGRVVGQHNGIERFTIGQRKGLGIALGEPYFVVRIEPDTARVVLGHREELLVTGLVANRLNWLADLPASPFRCLAQVRYNSGPRAAIVSVDPTHDELTLQFEELCEGVAPGQAVVCYQGDVVLGGGWIVRSLPPH